ncbi:hypothetical protein HDE_00603 [Halotydeus destructor]|nr:hypothetical protein HDE_00603 [Halotydeus destructor]
MAPTTGLLPTRDRSSTGYTSPARVAFSTNQKDSYASSGSGQVESLLAAYQQQSADAVDDNSKNAQHIQHDVNESDNLGSDHGQDYSAENLQSQNGDGFADDGQEYGQRTSADQQAGVY